MRHQHVVILSIDTLPVPRDPDADRIEIDDLGYGGGVIVHVGARFGYMETPDVPRALRLLDPGESEGLVDADRASYLLSKIELTTTPRGFSSAIATPSSPPPSTRCSPPSMSKSSGHRSGQRGQTRSPKRFVGNVGRELLDRISIINQRHADAMLAEYEHRALDQAAPLRPLPQPHYKGVDHCAHFILALEVRPEFAFRCGAGGSYRKPDPLL